MSNITLQTEGRRLYIAGNSYPIKDYIKAVGGHWDADRKQWWVGAGKKEEIESTISRATAKVQTSRIPQGENTQVIGKATYKGKSYFVVYAGQTTKGYAFKLCFRDGSKEFWADGNECAWIKRYQEPKTIKSIMQYAAKMKQEKPAQRTGLTKTCWECGCAFTHADARANQGDWSDSYCGC